MDKKSFEFILPASDPPIIKVTGIGEEGCAMQSNICLTKV